MEGASTLELLAELSIGLLGFSGIVVAVGRRDSRALNPAERARFFTMVLVGALVEILALLPFALHHSGLESNALWGWASILAAAATVFMNLMLARAARATPGPSLRVVWSLPTVSKTAIVVGYASLWGAALIFLLNSTALVFTRTFAPYLVGTLLLFSNALLAFVRLLNGAAIEQSVEEA